MFFLSPWFSFFRKFAAGLLQWNWARNPNMGDVPALGWNTGNIYYKAGRWTRVSNSGTNWTEQCFVILIPNEMELVVFANSQITNQGMSLTNLVRSLPT